jgi:hypothetical protein
LRVERDARHATAYLVVDEAPGEREQRTCDSAADAVREVARIWRGRLN